MKINCFAIYYSVTLTLNLMLMLLHPTYVTCDDWSASCASNCTCKWTNGKKSAICSSLQLSAVPTTLSTELQVLVLNDNHINNLNREEFTNLGLVNLQRIYLKKSNVQYVHKETFKNLKILVEIDLSDNKIEMLDKDTFVGNDRLRIIYLSGNPLKRLVAYQFPILPHLRTLDLHDCLIAYIDPMALANLNMLEFLYLKNNLLENLSEYVFQHMNNLKTLALEDNPWQCNCKLRKFRNWYINSKLNSVSLMCKGPPAQHNKLWERVDEQQYGCAPKVEIFNNEDTHDIDIGSNITFGCLVYGDPLPEVSWSLNGKVLDNDNIIFDMETIGSDKLWNNLTVFNMTSFDAGIYVCIATNIVGSSTQNISIYLSEIVQQVLVKTPETFWYFGLIMGTFGTVFFLIIMSLIVCFCKRTNGQRHRHPMKAGIKPSVSFNDQEKKLLDLSITTTTADRRDSCGLVDNNTTATVTTLSKADSSIGFQPIEIHAGNGGNVGGNRPWNQHYQKQTQHHTHLTGLPLTIPNGCAQILTTSSSGASGAATSAATNASDDIPTSVAAGHLMSTNEEFPLNVGVFPPPPEFCSNVISNPAYGNIFISVSVTQDMLDGNDINMYPDLLNIPKRMHGEHSSNTLSSPITMVDSNIASFATLPRNHNNNNNNTNSNQKRRGILKKDTLLQQQQPKQQQYQQNEHNNNNSIIHQTNLYPHDEIVSYHNLDTSYSSGYQEYQKHQQKLQAQQLITAPATKCYAIRKTGMIPTSCSTPPLDVGTQLRPLCSNTLGSSACLKYDNMGRRITASGNSTLSLPDEELLENETFFNEPTCNNNQNQQQQQSNDCIITEEKDEEVEEVEVEMGVEDEVKTVLTVAKKSTIDASGCNNNNNNNNTNNNVQFVSL